MIHYHGTPITPKLELFKLAGRNFCVSYSDPRNAEWCFRNAQSVMWDNGAFSSYTKGKKFNYKNYISWVDQYLYPPHWAVIPDIIGGEVKDQKQLLKEWPHSKDLSAPVWHMNLSIDWLLEISDNYPRFCFGSSGQYWKVRSETWVKRCDEAWNALTKQGNRSWVHMMRGLSLCGDVWPFASADSTNVARNFKNKGREVCPEKMIKRIDSVQSYKKWDIQEKQLDLI
jgi:hypothetical protein|tara:strand:- start:1722 stop:2402 length:681 start_codon:yes stop_codon:yes gene_type:complete